MEEYLTLGEAAALLGVSKSTVYVYVADGKITRYDWVGRRPYRRSDLVAAMNGTRVPGGDHVVLIKQLPK